MAVLKQTSPTASPSAPKPCPQITLPSARTNTPVAHRGGGGGRGWANGAGTQGVGCEEVEKTWGQGAGGGREKQEKRESGGKRERGQGKSEIKGHRIREGEKGGKKAGRKEG